MNNNALTIQSHKGPYNVSFGGPFLGLEKGLGAKEHLIIDAKVAELYSGVLEKALESPRVLKIEATEKNKSLEKIPEYVLHLTKNNIRRGDIVTAVGGGVVQDISAFIAAVLFRGMDWRFYPTTLLAQADSCIGSKSSINVGSYKNQVGTFTPPQNIHIATEVLETLSDADFRSGLGEVIKVHLISGENDFHQIQDLYPRLASDRNALQQVIRRSLEIKQVFVENDEFDQKERLVLNYGHSFGHAIESATHYGIPHGIAITIGMDMANYVSQKFGFISEPEYKKIHLLLQQNYAGFATSLIPIDRFFESLGKDKKNVGQNLSLILMKGPGKVFKDQYPFDASFRNLCTQFFALLTNGK